MQKLAVTAQAYVLNTPAHIQSTHDPSVSGAMVLPTSEGETMTTSKMEMAMRAEAPRTGATASTAPHTLKEPTHHHEADTSLGRCHNGLCFITGCSGIVIVNSSQSPVSEGSAFKPSAESLDHATTQCGALKDVLKSLPPVPKIVHVSVPQQALQLSPCTVREYGVLEAGIVRLSRLNPEWQVRLTGDDELERYAHTHAHTHQHTHAHTHQRTHQHTHQHTPTPTRNKHVLYKRFLTLLKPHICRKQTRLLTQEMHTRTQRVICDQFQCG